MFGHILTLVCQSWLYQCLTKWKTFITFKTAITYNQVAITLSIRSIKSLNANIYFWFSPRDYAKPKPYFILVNKPAPSWLRPSWHRAELTQGPSWFQAELTRYQKVAVKSSKLIWYGWNVILSLWCRVRTGLKSTWIYRTVLKSPWKLNLPWKGLEKHSKALKSPWILPLTGGFNSFCGDLNQ